MTAVMAALGETASQADDFPKLYNNDTLRDATPMPAQEAAATMKVPSGIKASLLASDAKESKLVLKLVNEGVFYGTIRGGFYVGDQNDFAYYPLPSRDDLETKHYQWFNSANRIKRL